jgi:hypothetical protein
LVLENKRYVVPLTFALRLLVPGPSAFSQPESAYDGNCHTLVPVLECILDITVIVILRPG